MNFVEEEMVIDVNFFNETGGSTMIMDSAAPLSIVSAKSMRKYIDEKQVNVEDKEYTESEKIFRFGENVYVSKKKVTYPSVEKEDED